MVYLDKNFLLAVEIFPVYNAPYVLGNAIVPSVHIQEDCISFCILKGLSIRRWVRLAAAGWFM
jgi:hypothetical protein